MRPVGTTPADIGHIGGLIRAITIGLRKHGDCRQFTCNDSPSLGRRTKESLLLDGWSTLDKLSCPMLANPMSNAVEPGKVCPMAI